MKHDFDLDVTFSLVDVLHSITLTVWALQVEA